MEKRIVCVYCTVIVLMTSLIFRIYYINASDYMVTANAQVQNEELRTRYNLVLANSRGNIYDRNMQGMVNREFDYIASVLPTPEAMHALYEITPEDEREALMQVMSAGMPFALKVEKNNLYVKGIDVFRIPRRYNDQQLAPHIIGYLDGGGQSGVAGIEKAYEEWLKKCGGTIDVTYPVDALGQVMQGGEIHVIREGEDDPSGGVVLTLDREIQNIVQNALAKGCEKGAAVVMDVQSGDILAMSSLPVFDQNDIASSLGRSDAPFINRVTSGYNIGSVFKLLVASAALENRIPSDHTYTCEGSVTVDGVTFRCNDNAIHGTIDMQRALQVSCNTYFIHLAQEMSPQYLLSFAQNAGMGTVRELFPGVEAGQGNLPSIQELQNPAAYANFSFGQGSSLATPLQMATVVSTIANGGTTVVPRIVMGMTEDGSTIKQHLPTYVANPIMDEIVAKKMQELMIGVIENGSGRTGKPLQGGAGGKTSSAQTGQLVDGEEVVHAWFAGFYPAEQPRYSIVVLVEGGESGEQVAAPIFKQIADGISGLQFVQK